MKLAPNSSSRLIKASKSSVEPPEMHKFILLPLVCLLIFGMAGGAIAAGTPFTDLKAQIAKAASSDSPGQFIAEIVGMVSAHPDQAEKIVAAAVAYKKDVACELIAAVLASLTPHDGTPVSATAASIVSAVVAEGVISAESCACDIVQEGIKALTPLNGSPDSVQVATLVVGAVQAVLVSQLGNPTNTNPDLSGNLVDCGKAVDPAAAAQIDGLLAQLPPSLTVHGTGMPQVPSSLNASPTPTSAPSATPATSATPTPPSVQGQVTPAQST